jgi:hypothetical protein
MKQTTISRSSVEAKYHVIAYTTCELLWSHSFLADFGIIIFILTPIYYDNQLVDVHIYSLMQSLNDYFYLDIITFYLFWVYFLSSMLLIDNYIYLPQELYYTLQKTWDFLCNLLLWVSVVSIFIVKNIDRV